LLAVVDTSVLAGADAGLLVGVDETWNVDALAEVDALREADEAETELDTPGAPPPACGGCRP
jgi:hypothetical protein